MQIQETLTTVTAKPRRAKDLDYLLKRLADKYSPLQIFCFHSKVEQSDTMGCFTHAIQEVSTNYYLLMVTENSSRIEHTVQDFASGHYTQGSVIMLVHGKESIEKSIESGCSFFKSVFQDGRMLYSYDGMFSTSKLDQIPCTGTGKDRQRMLEFGLLKAEGFLMGAKECFANGNFNISTFMLHQVVEQYCIALIGYYMDYRSDIHNLHRLLMLTRCFTEQHYLLFLGDREDARLFEILTSSYISCRYNPDFVISKFDLEKLINKVSKLISTELQI